METQALMMLDFSSVVDVVIYTSVEIRGKQTTIVLQKVFCSGIQHIGLVNGI